MNLTESSLLEYLQVCVHMILLCTSLNIFVTYAKGLNPICKRICAEYYEGKRQSCHCAITQHHAMKTYWGSRVIAPRILWPWH